MNEFEGKERGKHILDDSLRTNISLLRSFVSMLNETLKFGDGQLWNKQL